MKIRTKLLLSLSALILVIGALIGERVVFSGAFDRATQLAAAAETAGAAIALADEQLTMSASMAAVTGDAKWAARYESLVPSMESGIEAALSLAPLDVANRFDLETKEANNKLIAMESATLAAAAAGDLLAARAIIEGSDYAAQKKLLASGTDHFLTSLGDLTKADVDSVLNFGNLLAVVLSGVSIIAIGFAGYTVIIGVSRPLTRMESVMRELADGNIEVEIPYAGLANEIGNMAASVQAFQDNARVVRDMTEEEKSAAIRRADDRAEMMRSLQQAFSVVVDGAAHGQFDRCVELTFADAALNALGASVNNLVAAMAAGLSGTATVLSALAQTDLTKRMEGAYHGAFADLQRDTNAVVDNFRAPV
ncbi:MAG: HAMP domain-containing protein [Devosia sp.]